jgi:hypothetical protein
MEFRDWETALILPGRLTINVFSLTPEIPLESIDEGVLLWP